MTASPCSRLDELLAGRDADRLSAADEALLRRHLDECAACAARALRHDPALLFARGAGPEPLSDGERERFVGDVLASVAAARTARRASFVRRGGAGLRLAASLLLAASVAAGWFAWRGGEPSSAPIAQAPAPPAPLPAPAEPFPAVEEMASGDAVVYQFPATAPGEPTVVFVVDRNADI